MNENLIILINYCREGMIEKLLHLIWRLIFLKLYILLCNAGHNPVNLYITVPRCQKDFL